MCDKYSALLMKMEIFNKYKCYLNFFLIKVYRPVLKVPYAIRLCISAVVDSIWGLNALQCGLSLLASHFQLSCLRITKSSKTFNSNNC